MTQTSFTSKSSTHTWAVLAPKHSKYHPRLPEERQQHQKETKKAVCASFALLLADTEGQCRKQRKAVQTSSVLLKGTLPRYGQQHSVPAAHLIHYWLLHHLRTLLSSRAGPASHTHFSDCCEFFLCSSAAPLLGRSCPVLS